MVAVLALLSLSNLIFTFHVLIRHVLARPSVLSLQPGFWTDAVGKSAAVTGVLVLAWAIASSNRYLVVHFLSLEELAVYSLNYSIMSIASLVPMVIGFTLLHHVSHLHAIGRTEEAATALGESVALYVYAVLPLLALTGLFYPFLLDFLANPGYMVGVALLSSLLGYFFVFGLEQILVFATFAGDYRSALLARLLALAMALAMGVTFIPAFGIEAAAWPALAASVSIVAWCSRTLRRSMFYHFPWGVLRSVGPAWAVMVACGIVWTKAGAGHALWQAMLAAFLLAGLYLLVEGLMPGSITRSLIESARGTSGRKR
jgi:O-antigen/teichoic acid export membrane protein